MTYKTFRRICTALIIGLALCLEVKAQNIPVYGNLFPSDSGALNIGAASLHWDTIFVNYIYPPVSGEGIWSELNDSTIIWAYGGDTFLINTTTGTITIANIKTSSVSLGNKIIMSSPSGDYHFEATDSQQSQLTIFEDTDNGTNKITLQPPASLAATYTLTLPADDGNANEVLTTNGSGVTSWANKESVWDSLSGIGIQWQSDSSDALTITRTTDGFYAIAPSDSTLGLFLSTQNQSARIRLEEAGGDGAIYLETGTGISLTASDSLLLTSTGIGINGSFSLNHETATKIERIVSSSISNEIEIVVSNSAVNSATNFNYKSGQITLSTASNSGTTGAIIDTIAFSVNTNDFYLETQTGNIGIGTATPGRLLDVIGIGRFSDSLLTTNIAPTDSNISTIGTGNFRYSDSYINSMTTYSIIDEGSTVNTTASDTATINAISGRFRKDATGAAFTLTNSYITTSSIIVLTAANAAIDVTALTFTVSSGSGSAVITFNAAPTANFDMNFLIIN